MDRAEWCKFSCFSFQVETHRGCQCKFPFTFKGKVMANTRDSCEHAQCSLEAVQAAEEGVEAGGHEALSCTVS